MRRFRGWMLVVVLCGVAGTAGGAEPSDARLGEAGAAFEQASTLWDGRRYAEANASGERALALREAVLGGTHPEAPGVCGCWAPCTCSRGILSEPSRSCGARWPSWKQPPAGTIPMSPRRSSTSPSSTWPRGCTTGIRAALASRAWAATPLPGTRREAESIKRLLPQAELFLGAHATKERLLRLPAPGILHLATHGFFLEDAPPSPASRAVVHLGELGEDAPAPSPPDPLLRSGLVLAGASAPAASDVTPPTSSLERTESSGPPLSGATSSAATTDSGLVTALELAGLNLWGTQLVVLSACDTGRGDVKPGQGVYGLHRAFLVAGAETVVMSLWKVNDETTRTLMEAYYRHLLAGRGRALALREAMRELRLTQAHPYYWAPFIAVGSDAPLRRLAPLAQRAPDPKLAKGR